MGVGPVRRFLRRMQGDGKASLVDVGCGTGANALLAARMGFRTAACDLSHASLGETRRVARALGIDARLGMTRADCLALPFPDASFDVLIASHIIEHLEAPERLLMESLRVLRPGGVLRLSCPSRNHGMRVSRWLGMELDPEDHQVLGYRRDALAGMLPAGFRVTRTTYQGRVIEANAADAQQMAARALGWRANPISKPAESPPAGPRIGLVPYLVKEAVLLPLVAMGTLEDTLLPFTKGCMITIEARKE